MIVSFIPGNILLWSAALNHPVSLTVMLFPVQLKSMGFKSQAIQAAVKKAIEVGVLDSDMWGCVFGILVGGGRSDRAKDKGPASVVSQPAVVSKGRGKCDLHHCSKFFLSNVWRLLVTDIFPSYLYSGSYSGNLLKSLRNSEKVSACADFLKEGSSSERGKEKEPSFPSTQPAFPFSDKGANDLSKFQPSFVLWMTPRIESLQEASFQYTDVVSPCTLILAQVLVRPLLDMVWLVLVLY